MDTSFQVPIWRIFLNWLIAIIAGSIFWPIAASMFDGGTSLDIEEIGGAMLISAVLSGLSSIPAILLLLLVTWQLNKQKVQKSTYRTIHTAAHLFVALLTFGVIYPFADLSDKEMFFFLLVAFSYTLAGIFSWAVTFSIYSRKNKEIPATSEELLDGRIS